MTQNGLGKYQASLSASLKGHFNKGAMRLVTKISLPTNTSKNGLMQNFSCHSYGPQVPLAISRASSIPYFHIHKNTKKSDKFSFI
jgi:hypothetical protein